MGQRVLIVDDDDALAGLVSEYLTGRGFQVEHRSTAALGLHAALHGGYDVVLLDVMLPDGDGMDLCRQIRQSSTVPILMLTARGEDTDRIVGLELGADDYLSKPFNPRELSARIKAVLRRSGPSIATDVVRFGGLEIDRGARCVRRDGEMRPLTQHQFELLLALVERTGRVLSRNQLMEVVRGEELEAFDRSIDVHVSRIRAAIEVDPKHPTLLLTVRGAGYVFTGQAP
jgi:two-component system, OmpR family, phosphate regulon response regulator OmpR